MGEEDSNEMVFTDTSIYNILANNTFDIGQEEKNMSKCFNCHTPIIIGKDEWVALGNLCLCLECYLSAKVYSNRFAIEPIKYTPQEEKP